MTGDFLDDLEKTDMKYCRCRAQCWLSPGHTVEIVLPHNKKKKKKTRRKMLENGRTAVKEDPLRYEIN